MIATILLHLILLLQSPLQQKSTQIESASDSLKVHLYADLCYEYRLISQDSAIIFGEKAISLAQKINYEKGLAQAYNDLGIIYADKADFENAQKLYQLSLDIRKNQADSLGMAALYSKIGILYQKIGKIDSALFNQLMCLDIYEQKGSYLGINQTLNNIAILYFNKKNFQKSLEYHYRALAMREDQNDVFGISISHGNIGNVFFEKSDYFSAIKHYKKSLHLLKASKSLDHLASVTTNLANCFTQMNELDSAISYLNQSIGIKKEINDVKGLVSGYCASAQISIKNNLEKEALLSYESALEIAEEHNLLSDQSSIHLAMIDLLSSLGKYEKALSHSLAHINLTDSLQNESLSRITSELLTKYETEKKEQQISLQKAEIAEQKAQNQRNLAAIGGLFFMIILLIVIVILNRSRSQKKHQLIIQEAETLLREAQVEAALNSQESERRRFARDLHDGFGQMISVLNLNLKSLEKESTDRQSVFENSSKILDQMYKELKGICFNLMPETLIKNGVVDAIKEFALRVNQSGKIHLEVDAFGMEERLSDLQEISLYRITQEWINNIIKYSDANEITISLTKDDDEITLLIEDNGAGFDQSLLIEGKGNGWKNLNSRTNLIKGELELDTAPGMKGSTLIMNAPLNHKKSSIEGEKIVA